jgi:chromate transporter
VLHGGSGALVATLGIFLPAFFFVAVTAPLLPKLRSSPTAGHILDGINVASLALMGVVTWQLGRAAIIDVPTLFIAITSAVLLLMLRINSAWLVVAAGVFGWLHHG